jgi:excinuclease ABC subunit A
LNKRKEPRPIRLGGVRHNNLKNITVEIPGRSLTVITGLSGSGKSSLAFETLYAEGQRRYVESLSTYTRQFLEKMPKPELDWVENIPPAIALEQKNHVVNSRSTVGTQTEILDYLRVLFAKIGTTYCKKCGDPVVSVHPAEILDWAITNLPGTKALLLAPLRLSQTEPPRKKGEKKPTPKARAALRNNQLLSLVQVALSQGFKRLVSQTGEGEPETHDLEETDPATLLTKSKPETRWWVVIDRLKLSQKVDADLRGRLLDSIDQAVKLGRDHATFLNLDTGVFKEFELRFACLNCGTPHTEPSPQLFAFNNPIGACSECSGFGFNLELDEKLVVPDPSKAIKNGAIDPFSKPSFSEWQSDLFRFAERHGISIGKRYRELTPAQKKLLWDGHPDDTKFLGIKACFEDLKRYKYKLHIRVFIRRYQSQSLCSKCQGTRLRDDALAVRVGKLNLPDLLNLPLDEALPWVRALELGPAQKKIAGEVFSQVERRLDCLVEVGVGYLTLSRLAKSLSGGEFQRINLATQIGNGLCGTCYILDEPSIGLHAADTDRLIRVLHRLRDQGNTVVVVEHDIEVIKSADHLIEIGPAAGRRGGEIVAQGTAQALIESPGSITGKYLSGAFRVQREAALRGPHKRSIRITGCRENNLKNIDVEFPLDRLVVVTGVSGSGKSTLVHKTLYQALKPLFEVSTETAGTFDKLYGADQISGVVMLDQSSIGRSSRSNPVTYLKAWDEVRRIYSNQAIALRRGFTAQHFSFNVDGGRCPVCKGEGEILLDMHFMAEVRLTCEECDGKRFKKTVLDVSYRSKNIDQLLHSTIDEAFELFRDNPILSRKLGILRDVGLGYLLVGQSGATLSGGESQRLKIAATLDDRSKDQLLYIFDEPTTGLHLEDVKRLMNVIQDLVAAKHSVILIEHHLDVIAQADWVIDLGPGGGRDGGDLVAAQAPDRLILDPKSVTGEMLRKQGYSFASTIEPGRLGQS